MYKYNPNHIGQVFKDESGKQIIHITDSAESFIHDCNVECDMDKDRDKRRASRRNEDGASPWSGATSWEEAKRFAEHGWPEGREYMDDYDSEALIQSYGSRGGFDVKTRIAGGAINIGRYLSGEPECFMYMTPSEQSKGRVVKMLVSLTASAGISEKAIKQYGLGVVASIDILEQSGYRVEVTRSCGTTAIGKMFLSGSVIKNAEEPLDLDKMLFWIASPAAFRRLNFGLWETYPDTIRRNIPGGYGVPVTWGQFSNNWKGKMPLEYDVVLDPSNLAVTRKSTQEAALEHATNIIEKKESNEVEEELWKD